MKTELKKQIIEFIFNNEKDFQIHNRTVSNFSMYIYNNGEYLIGGEDVYKFIGDAIKLITQNR